MVNTFLPYASFARSARILDGSRLNKQRLEVTWILRALHGGAGYAHHPATIMWRGYHEALVSYGLHVHDELTRRGVPDREGLSETIASYLPFVYAPDAMRRSPQDLRYHNQLPWWFGWRRFHQSHRSNLKRKDLAFYCHFTDVPEDMPYVWPKPDERSWFEKHAGAPAKDKRFYSSSPPPTPG